MAFIAPLPLHASQSTLRVVQRRPPRWTCLAKKKGDGVIPTEIDYTGYDPVAMKAELEREEALYKSLPVTPDLTTPWAIIISSDIIQRENNLFSASYEQGFQWDLTGVKVVRMVERSAMRAIKKGQTSLLVVMIGEGMLYIEDAGGKILLAFERKQEADRFVELMKADGVNGRTVSMEIKDLKEGCERSDMIMGMVPGGVLVSPGMFEKIGNW